MMRLGFPIFLSITSALLAGWCAGCDAPHIKPVLTDSDPSVKIPAMELAVAHNDRSAIPILIKNLESDDPAVRFYANDALRKLTSHDFGFLYYADDETRWPAVQKWRKWFAASTGPTSNVTTQP